MDELPAVLRARWRAAHATIYPYGPFPVGDGKTVMLGLQNEREWEQFCARVLEQPALATDPRFASNAARSAAREALRAIIVESFSRQTAQQVVERLDAAQIANAHMNDMHDLWRHAQLQARRRWTEVDTPAGKIPASLPPGVPNTYSARMDPVPGLGQHTDAILGQLGHDEASLRALREAGAI